MSEGIKRRLKNSKQLWVSSIIFQETNISRIERNRGKKRSRIGYLVFVMKSKERLKISNRWWSTNEKKEKQNVIRWGTRVHTFQSASRARRNLISWDRQERETREEDSFEGKGKEPFEWRENLFKGLQSAIRTLVSFCDFLWWNSLMLWLLPRGKTHWGWSMTPRIFLNHVFLGWKVKKK